MIKRVFDVCGAALLLALCAPVMLLVALLIRLRMGTPVLLRQTRPGIHGRPFTFFKFRTMTEERDASGQLLSDELRLTPLGRALRRTSLDELPQIINVIRGDMSLVGPRPLLMEYLPLYSAEQARRHDVRPGVTGWAQVNGRNAVAWEERFRLDVWYVDHCSMLLDLKILALTVLRVLHAQGVAQPGHATMPRFAGQSEKHRDA